MTAPRRRGLRVVGLILTGIPLVLDAVSDIADTLDDVTDPDSDGGRKVTEDEAASLIDRFHAALRPVAEHVVRGLVRR